MPYLRTIRSGAAFLALVTLTLTGFIATALAQGNGFVLPPGQVVIGPVARGQNFSTPGQSGTTIASITNGLDANNYLLGAGGTGGFVTSTTLSFINSTSAPATVVLTSAPTQYVRFYNPVAGSNQAGSFIVATNAVRGLTAAQIKDVLALPFLPTMQTLVQLPAGTCILIGAAGPITNSATAPTGFWGRGGAVQEFLIGKDRGGGCSSSALYPLYTDRSDYINGQALGSAALLYAPHVSGKNAGSVASALDRGPYPVQFSGMDSLYNALDVLNFGNTAQLQSALLQLDGEVHATTQTVLLGDSLYIRQALLGRMRQASFARSAGSGSALAFGGPSVAYADGTDPRLGEVRSDYGPGFGEKQAALPENAETLAGTERKAEFWVQGIGAWGSSQGDGNAAGFNRSLAGFLAGADYRITPNWIAGVAGGYTNSSVGISTGTSASTIASAHVAGYTGASFGAWNVRAGLAASFNTIASNRTINFPGFADALSANYSATTTQVFSEVGYGLSAGRIGAEPFAGLAFAHLDTSGFSEIGNPGIAALSSSGNSTNVGFSTLGLRAATNFNLTDSMVLVPRLSAAWQHAYGAVAPTSTLAFVANGASFTTTALPMAQDSLLLEAGVALRFNRQLALEVSYLGQLAYGSQDTWLTGRVSLRF